MGRGVSCGGGQSSLGYLFGDGTASAPPPSENPTTDDATTEPSKTETTTETNESAENPPAAEPINKIGQNAADTTTTTTTTNEHDSTTNNYFRADGQNCGNFITNRPSTKVHAAPGGSSSLGYLFNDEKK